VPDREESDHIDVEAELNDLLRQGHKRHDVADPPSRANPGRRGHPPGKSSNQIIGSSSSRARDSQTVGSIPRTALQRRKQCVSISRDARNGRHPIT
jgi:hypothetical protein